MSKLAIGRGLLGHLGRSIREAGLDGRVFIISDDQVFPRYGTLAARGLRDSAYDVATISLPAGERTKTLATASALYDWLVDQRAERRDTIVAL
ncbi:MAG TPA: 3-dehydroquinate synthase, partial [Chloroflexota bacterium]|nr:3-dehydroquinate synthase [Chloroflexota bacterium]